MSNEIALPATFNTGVASVFKGQATANDTLGAGITASYAVLGFKGKVWTNKYQGVDTPLMRDDGDGPRGSVEVVLVEAAAAVSKIYYAQGWIDGSNEAPDCWSSNGVAPDASVKVKMNPTCADCPFNAWGSKVTEAGKNSKMCSDSRRVAVVPLSDIENEMFGGPMLLRVPAASLKDLAAYGKLLNSYDVPYFAAGTRISFDVNESYPKFVFSAMRPLNDTEAAMVKALKADKRVKTVLMETADTATVGAAAEAKIRTSPFEEGQTLSQQATATGPGPAAAAAAAAKKPGRPAKATTSAGNGAAGAAPVAAAAAAATGPSPEEVAARQTEIAAAKLVAEREAAAKAAAEAAAIKAKRIAEIKAKQAAELAALEAEEAEAEAGDVPEGAVTMTSANFDDMLDSLLK